MSSTLATRCLWVVVWGLVLAGTLSLASVPGDGGHAVCGAWGCGPPIQTLVACHVSWLVVLGPPVLALRGRTSPRTLRRGASGALAVAILFVSAIAVQEFRTWGTRASPWQGPLYWQRVGFVLLTTVEVPVLEVVGLAIAVIFWPAACYQLPARWKTSHWDEPARADADETGPGADSSHSRIEEGGAYPDSV